MEPPEESATAVRPVPRLLVSVGIDLSDVAPLPNWPWFGSPARHSTVVKDGAGVVPPEESATAVRPVPRLLVSVGVVLSDVPPLPNGRRSLSPARHSTVVKDGAGVESPEESATAVRPVPRLLVSVGVICQTFTITQLAGVPAPSTTQHRCQGWRRCGYPGRERYCCATCTEAAGERGVVLSDVPPLPNWP